MKKQRIIKLVSAALALSILVSCAPQETQSANPDSSVDYTSFGFRLDREKYLSEEIRREISACIKKDNYEYQEGQYFGAYNNYHVVLISQIDGIEYRDAQIVEIAGYPHYIGDTEKLIAYKDGSYMPLSKAYSKGKLTKSDIKIIMYLYDEYYSSIVNDEVVISVENDNDPDKKYGADDFSEIKIKEIKKSAWLSYETKQVLTIVLPIKNRRNVLNTAKKLKKRDNILSAEVISVGRFPVLTTTN